MVSVLTASVVAAVVLSATELALDSDFAQSSASVPSASCTLPVKPLLPSTVAWASDRVPLPALVSVPLPLSAPVTPSVPVTASVPPPLPSSTARLVVCAVLPASHASVAPFCSVTAPAASPSWPLALTSSAPPATTVPPR